MLVLFQQWGGLHQGHTSLIELCVADNELSVVSIFVNPTQFNDPNDYQSYPNNLKKDLELLEHLGVDYVLLPCEQDIYPQGHCFSITTDHPEAQGLEGDSRPGHLSGVLTVVLKLLQIVGPGRAYFGEKDYQQYYLVKAMVADFFLPVDIVLCPTVRDKFGLPYSSRNEKLTPSQKQLAQKASLILHQAQIDKLDEVKSQLEKMGVNIEYLRIRHGRLFYGMTIGDIHLIDNFMIEEAVC